MASTAITMQFDTDPKKVIMGRLPKDIGDLQILANDVLVAMFDHDGGKTAGGIIVVNKEGQHQGKAGLIIAKGPQAFMKDEKHNWGGTIPEVGDWVSVWVMDAVRSLHLGNQICRVVEDVHVKMILPRPDMVY